MSSEDVTVSRGASVPQHPKVSVVIPAFRPRWLHETLESVRAQTLGEVEIIVVDDGSPEPIRLERMDDLVVVRQRNSGPGAARNLGVKMARADNVAFVDDDDLWLPQKLEKQLAFQDSHPDHVLSFTDVVPFSQAHGLAPDHEDLFSRRYRITSETVPFEKLFFENCVPTSAAMVRRSAYLKTKGMTPNCRMAEDFPAWLRLGCLGKIGFVDEVLTYRRRREGSLSSVSMAQGTWRTRERAVYEEFLAEHPELADEPFVKEAFARFEFQSAYIYLTSGEWAESRRACMKSLSHKFMQPKVWKTLARAVLHVGSLRQR